MRLLGAPASRRAGEMLAELPKNEGSKGQLISRGVIGGIHPYTANNDTPTLADIGITKMQSSRFQAIASVPATARRG